MKIFIVALLFACIAMTSLGAVTIPLQNPGFEMGAATFWYSPQAGVPGVVTHAAYPHPNNGTLGTYFAYYSPGDFTTTWIGQLVDTNYTANTGYRFSAWLSNGGSGTGGYEIGYCATPGDLATFTAVARAQYDISNAWALYPGVTYITEPSTVGKQIAVRFPNIPGNAGGVWLDAAQFQVLTPAPPIGWCNLQWPTVMVVAAVGGTAVTEKVYGQVWISGVTSIPGSTPGLNAWLGYGPTNAMPDAATWQWIPADFNTNVGNNAEFYTNLTIETSITPSVYAYCYKYQYDTNELPSGVRYGQKDGIHTLASYNPAQSGLLTVVPEPLALGVLAGAIALAYRRR